jgi:nucleotide-binding universal stress UspA family protein
MRLFLYYIRAERPLGRDETGAMSAPEPAKPSPEPAFEAKARPVILAPVDFSPASEISGQYAAAVARALQGDLVFLYVIPENPLSGNLLFPSGRLEAEAGLRDWEQLEARERFEVFLRSLSLEGVSHRLIVEKGAPYRRILEAVERLSPRLVIQGTHGVSGLGSMVIGGTAEWVIRQTNCPVISIKPRGFGSFLNKIVEGIGLFDGDEGERRRQRDYPFPPRTILYATDFSEASRLAMEPALKLAKLNNAELIVLHVTDEETGQQAAFEEGGSGEGEPLTASGQMESLVKQMRAYAEELRIRPMVLSARSTSVILSVAVDEEADLLVVGTRGRAAWKTILTGSTAHRLLRNAPCPVLTVRPNWKLEEVERRFHKVFRKLSPVELQQISSESRALFSEEVLLGPEDLKEPDLFLNFYTREGLMRALEEYGILDLLRGRGLDGFRVLFDLSDTFRHRLRIYYGEQEDPEHLLIDLIVREGVLKPSPHWGAAGRPPERVFTVLVIEWLLLQNPAAAFTAERPPLPGQAYPGLGVGYQAHQFLALMGKRLRKDATVNHPQYYHNARLYHEAFMFYDPVQEGRLIALIRDTGDSHIADVSWALYHGCLLDEATGEGAVWGGGEMVYPLAEDLKRFFRSAYYQDTVWDTVASTRYRIDWERYRQKMQSASGAGRSAASTGA